jgi:hypothetical protein
MAELTPRADLLALTQDDLAVLSNRGTVKRALKELEAGDPSCDWSEQPDGTLVAAWSDGTECRFPAGKPVQEARCSSEAQGISRHVIRSVLDYQQRMRERAGESESAAATETAIPSDATKAEAPTTVESWDPGEISDEQLQRHFGKAAITRSRSLFDRGIVALVERGTKPVCRFLHEPCAVRFLVRDDLNYVHAECSEKLRSTYVPWAVWTFRELAADQTSGLVSIENRIDGTPIDLLDEVETLALELMDDGIQSLAPTYVSRVQRLVDRLNDAGMVWPAEVWNDLLAQIEAYRAHDARFEPAAMVDLVGELFIRSDAIRHDRGAVPRLLVQGSRSERTTEIAYGRFIGLGCSVRSRARSVEITAFMQEIDSGTVAAVDRTYTDPEPDSGQPVKDFGVLARGLIGSGVSLSELGEGQLLLKSGNLTPAHRLLLPRSRVHMNPQTFAWEKLRPPVLVDSFAEASTRLQALPPKSLRPRRLTEDLAVLKVADVEGAAFDPVSQSLTAIMKDGEGNSAILCHAYSTRARQGFERFWKSLNDPAARLSHVAGQLRPTTAGLVISPTCAVFELSDRRIAVQPWVDRPLAESDTQAPDSGRKSERGFRGADVLQRLNELLAEALTTGVRKLPPQVHRRWQELSRLSEAAGFVKWPSTATRFADEFARRLEVRDWSSKPALGVTRELLVLSRLFQDLADGR